MSNNRIKYECPFLSFDTLILYFPVPWLFLYFIHLLCVCVCVCLHYYVSFLKHLSPTMTSRHNFCIDFQCFTDGLKACFTFFMLLVCQSTVHKEIKMCSHSYYRKHIMTNLCMDRLHWATQKYFRGKSSSS